MPFRPQVWSTLEMLLEVADSSITYRSRYFTAMQAALVLDLLMNDEANPRSLAFQLKICGSTASGWAGWHLSPNGQ